MARITYGKGSMSVVVDDGTADLVRKAVEKVAPGLVRMIEDEMRQLHDAAKADWPVGPDKAERNNEHSRDKLGYEVQIDPSGDTIRGRVFNTAWWAKFIRPRGHRGKKAQIVFLRKPLLSRQRTIVDKMGPLVKAGLEG